MRCPDWWWMWRKQRSFLVLGLFFSSFYFWLLAEILLSIFASYKADMCATEPLGLLIEGWQQWGHFDALRRKIWKPKCPNSNLLVCWSKDGSNGGILMLSIARFEGPDAPIRTPWSLPKPSNLTSLRLLRFGYCWKPSIGMRMEHLFPFPPFF
jgi:hypothetical protein